MSLIVYQIFTKKVLRNNIDFFLANKLYSNCVWFIYFSKKDGGFSMKSYKVFIALGISMVVLLCIFRPGTAIVHEIKTGTGGTIQKEENQAVIDMRAEEAKRAAEARERADKMIADAEEAAKKLLEDAKADAKKKADKLEKDAVDDAETKAKDSGADKSTMDKMVDAAKKAAKAAGAKLMDAATKKAKEVGANLVKTATAKAKDLLSGFFK